MDNLFLPQKDREYLESKNLRFLEIKAANQNGLVIEDYVLPLGKYNVPSTHLLILIPQGYNDTHPDMFYCCPKLTLMPNNNLPAATGGQLSFNNQTWQQWSRHLTVGNDWRPGIDGISSYLQKVKTALEIG